jgi:pyruvate ferredoxin oxidoreductase gamma subunit
MGRKTMIQIRIHGRGGQGVVTAAELLSLAAFKDGKVAHAFPSFGSERTGAPVMAFCRIATHPIRSREPVLHPDVVLIQDSTLLHQVEVLAGLAIPAIVLINSTRTVEALHLTDFLSGHPGVQVHSIPASDLALKHMGRPFANIGMVAGYAALTGEISMPSVNQAIKDKFPGGMGELNVAVAEDVFEYVAAHMVQA